MSETTEVHEMPEEPALPEETAAVETPAAVEAPPVAMSLPGSVLRETREAKHLTVFEVAQFLKFSPRQIEALEADDYAVLPPGATFLRGFVRGYAKLLKLDPTPLLAMLDAQAPAMPPDVREPQNMGVAATSVVTGRRASRPMLIGSAVFAVVAMGLGAWHFLGASAGAAKPAPVAAANGDAAALRPPDIRVEETPLAAPGQAEAIPGDSRQLVFVFQEKSWVEVSDATRRIIFSGESPAGSRQAVAGKPPFQLVIGNAAKVELQYEDRQIDLKPYTRAEVARLTLE